jgi:phosphoglycolate phosphatase-like HAD superfamily hydrolase
VAAVAVDSGSHARAELLAAGPSCCLGGVGELPAWLAGQR